MGALYDLLAAADGGAPAQGHQADRHQRDLAHPGAAEDHADGGLPGGAALCAVPGVGLRRAGLYSHEKKFVLPLVVSSTLLFFIGVAFCYFIVIPAMSKFIQAFAPTAITAAPDIEQYFGFVLTLFMVFGIAFEVPVAVVVLARIGLVTIEQLKAVRGYFIVGAFIVAAVVTPPDVISQLSLAIPMCILYELGILAAQAFIKQTKAPEDDRATRSRRSR
jgi:sec-independent protein translocase protein TatC